MASPSVDREQKQAANAEQNQAHATAAKVSKQLGMVRRADQMIAPSRRNAPGDKPPPDSRKRGADVGKNKAASGAAADGYVRKTPVQEIKIDPAYKNRLFKRALTLTAVLAAIVVIIYFMSRYIAFF